ncbi:hypothetical protein V6N11_032131 [Hibiscus sabdariffa]|uniref:Uncharacterized protein n=1 Tax=Hibiscus sabdariffa TaxID=183260 RepID=A0ABR2SZR7_9ROSI
MRRPLYFNYEGYLHIHGISQYGEAGQAREVVRLKLNEEETFGEAIDGMCINMISTNKVGRFLADISPCFPREQLTNWIMTVSLVIKKNLE